MVHETDRAHEVLVAPVMKFEIGPWTYSVQITDGPLYDDNGLEQAGRCEWRTQSILISGAIPVTRRLEVLLHELRHAWVFTFGRPAGEEDDANNAAAFAAMAINEIDRHGGTRALMQLGEGKGCGHA